MIDREQHLKQIRELKETLADPCEGTIYHYTTEEAFHGILESSELWLTNAEFVNDITECNALSQQQDDLFEDDELSLNRYVEKWWDWFFKDKNQRENYYIASFSKEPDSLEQWRAYGSICIGFDAQRLKRNGFFLYTCVYNKEEIGKWILEKAKAKEWVLNEPDRTRSYIAEDGVATTSYEDGRDGVAFSLIFNALIKFKQHYYRNEKEVRLLAVSHHDWGLFPNSPSMYESDPPIYFRLHLALKVPIPYVKFFIPCQLEGECDSNGDYVGKTELEIKEEKRQRENKQKRALLPIKEIWIGPTQHKEETRVSCEILLKEKGYKDVKINVSEIPYRGF
jgi:hypothetical protein